MWIEPTGQVSIPNIDDTEAARVHIVEGAVHIVVVYTSWSSLMATWSSEEGAEQHAVLPGLDPR